MGEAKRRRAPSEADGLPDFMFVREKAAEEACGFILAGRLVTNIPKRPKPSEREARLISEIINGLLREVRRDPHLQEAGIWRNGVEPPDELKLPFVDAAMLARVKRCAVVVVRIDPRNDGLIRMDDSLMAEIEGRH